MFVEELNRKQKKANAVTINGYCVDPYSKYLPVPRRVYSVLKFASDSMCAALLKGKRHIGKFL